MFLSTVDTGFSVVVVVVVVAAVFSTNGIVQK